jgi:outer membrane receptor protein involved in Fe transport
LDYPKKKATARLGYSTGEFSSNLMMVACSKLPSNVSGFARFDWSFTWKLSEKGKFSLKVNNLFDRKYYSIDEGAKKSGSRIPGVERTLWLGLEFSY